VSAFFRRAEEILGVATSESSDLGDVLVVLDRQGGFRMLEPTGWSLPALAAEFGAEAVYKVERRGLSVRVEGWDGSRRCLLQGPTGRNRAYDLFGAPFAPQATMLKLTAPAIA
jgi:hypothetical protein